MSQNRYMHPRNIYKSPPNFKQLAIDYPEFRKHVKQDLAGKVTLDFKDINALRALTCTLLKKDFELDVEIPLNKLVPTVPLRVNYILWIEDLLSISGGSSDVHGIDIGTGASCVYSLLAAKNNKWCMLATEVDSESTEFAKRNAEKNNLHDLITIKKVNETSVLQEAVADDPSKVYDFCMCNPPFFASPQDVNPFFKCRKEGRPRPRNAFCASTKEVVSKGGEVEFIGKLIRESKSLNKQIRIYSTMVGHKSSLSPLKQLLREMDMVSFKQTEFCQGHTTRWGLAWTFYDIDLRKVPESTVIASRKQKPKPPLQHVFRAEHSVHEFADKLREIFVELDIEVQELKRAKNTVIFNITAYSDTWSHQRRKRRQEARMKALLNNNQEVDIEKLNINRCKVDSSSSKNEEMDIDIKRSPKREMEDEDDGYYNLKKVKVSANSEDFVLKSFAVIRKDANDVYVELSWLEGTDSKEALHQILQYIKNNLKFS